METLSLAIQPLAPLGAEVVGIDLRNRIDDATAQRLRAAYNEHALLLFRDQDLEKEDLLRFASVIGPVSEQGEAPGGFNYLSTVFKPGATAKGEWTLASGFGELAFHFDHCFQEWPLKAIMLYGLEVPPPGAGGDTMFSDTRLATKMLPAELFRRIEHLTILHKGVKRTGRPEAVHPLVWKHPATGVPVLFFSKYHAIKIVELSQEDSDALIDELAKYVVRDETLYTHKWKAKDLVVWDNLALQHARTDFDPQYTRHMMRVQIGFETPGKALSSN